MLLMLLSILVDNERVVGWTDQLDSLGDGTGALLARGRRERETREGDERETERETERQHDSPAPLRSHPFPSFFLFLFFEKAIQDLNLPFPVSYLTLPYLTFYLTKKSELNGIEVA